MFWLNFAFTHHHPPPSTTTQGNTPPPTINQKFHHHPSTISCQNISIISHKQLKNPPPFTTTHNHPKYSHIDTSFDIALILYFSLYEQKRRKSFTWRRLFLIKFWSARIFQDISQFIVQYIFEDFKLPRFFRSDL